MALINCPDCSTSVSDQAVSCIKCGRPIRCDIQREKRQQSYKQIQTFWSNSIVPGIKQTCVLGVTGLLGLITKFVSLFFIPGIMNSTLSFTDLGKIAIAESGLYVIGSYLVLALLLKLKIVPWLNEIFPEPVQESKLALAEKKRDCQVIFDVPVTMDRCIK